VAGNLARYELHHEDETHLDTNPYLGGVWHRRGQQMLLPAAGTNRRLTDFGSGEVFGRGRVEVLCAEQSSAGSANYLAALDGRHVATGRDVFLALDHASCHDSDQSQAALAARATWLHVIPLARPQVFALGAKHHARDERQDARQCRSHRHVPSRTAIDYVPAACVARSFACRPAGRAPRVAR
jgi:hypothetical protein